MSRHSSKKKKSSNIAKAVRILILITAFAVFFYALYQILTIRSGYQGAVDEYTALQESFTAAYDGSSQASSGSEADLPVLTPEEENWLIEDADPPLSVDFASLQAINPEIVGWIYIDARPTISYPILRGSDNAYYLHHTFRGEDNFSGSIFMEYTNSADFSDPNTIVYGHNMKNQSMFGLLKYLRDQSVYDSAPYFWILTPEGNYRYHIYAAFETPYDSDAYTLFYGRGDDFLAWEEKMQKNSEVVNDVALAVSDHTVLLSTCTSDSNIRCVVLGKCVSSARPPMAKEVPHDS